MVVLNHAKSVNRNLLILKTNIKMTDNITQLILSGASVNDVIEARMKELSPDEIYQRLMNLNNSLNEDSEHTLHLPLILVKTIFNKK